jgi:menaquinone-dependent protoporphyrinogen IX oxidase
MKKRDFLKTGVLGIGAMALTRKANALEYYPRDSDKKWAVLYATWCGSSRDAAVWISEGMDGIANVFDVREKAGLRGYDHLVIGGSIRGGQTSPQLQEYLKENRDWLGGKVRGLFAVCGNMMQPVGPEQTENFITNHLAVLSGAGEVPSRVFLGRITFGLMEPDIREQMQSMPNIREYDNLKRTECMAFGKEVLASVS